MDSELSGSVAPQTGIGTKPAGSRQRRVAVIVLTVGVGVAVVLGGHPARTAATQTTHTPTTTGGATPRASLPVLVPPGTQPAETTSTLDFLEGTATHTKLVVCGPGHLGALPDLQLTVLDLDANRAVSLPFYVSPSPGVGCHAGFVRGHLFAQLSSGGSVSVIADDLTEGSRDIGGEGFLVTPGNSPTPWIVDGGPGHAYVTQADSAGDRWNMVFLPAGWVPFAATAYGLVLVQPPDGRAFPRFEVWDPLTGAVRLRGQPGTVAIAANGNDVVWSYLCSNEPCPGHVTDLATGRDQTTHLESYAAYSSGWNAAISPNGQFLAEWYAHQSAPTPLLLENLVTGTVQSLDPGPARFNGPWSLAWSSTGQWLFLASSSNAFAYDLGDPRVSGQLNLPTGLLNGGSLSAS